MIDAAPNAIRLPSIGDLVRIRTRTWLVESVENPSPGQAGLVGLSCLDDDAQGDQLAVLWEIELDAQVLDAEAWKAIGQKGFDDPNRFGAYLRTLRWNCVTATDAKLFQAPFRAGIKIDAYQLEPLRKALQLPRVNLFIADDVGLGKTIEAGLIATELLLRRRVRDIVVSCPPTMLQQWKDELENRFGLVFQILDRRYIEQVRRERGYGVNPWSTYPRFLISHRLLIDEVYAGPMRVWLDNLRPGSLLILDEAHHAAPSTGSRYASDSRITHAVRDLAPRFEHRLFLSATPHNGHSNSFSALLEILDRNRFTRGVKVLPRHLRDVMVRRLKEDVREVAGGFPRREVVQVDLDQLPLDTPELVLAALLDEYRTVREARLEGAPKRKQAEAALLVSGLQQRLFSSIEAFARTLKVHRRTMERLWAGEVMVGGPVPDAAALTGGFDGDDDRSGLTEAEQAELLEAAAAAATLAGAGDSARADVAREKALVAEMERVAERHRGQPDARVRFLIEWIRGRMCAGAAWTDLRLLIFTEYEDTKRYLADLLRLAVAGSDRAEERIEVLSGATPSDRREAIKQAFNLPPTERPIRILVATDAAREGINLQAQCWNLFHFDLPWNPSRLEQRNGRIDRKLQPAATVFCHYFHYHQRVEDRVLRALVRKTETIRVQLGSLAQVLEARLAATVSRGIRRDLVDQIEQDIGAAELDPERRREAEEELDTARDRQDELREQIDGLRTRIAEAKKWIGFDPAAFRNAISTALEISGAPPLNPVSTPPGKPSRFQVPPLDGSWSRTLDTLRQPPLDGRRTAEWRSLAGIRPVIFSASDEVDDGAVHLHLQHRLAQRLLGRFTSQGFVHHDLSRACLAQSADAIPRVVLLGRLALFGPGATRLHEEILTVAARWTERSGRKTQLTPYGRDGEAKTLELLEGSLAPGSGTPPAQVQARLLATLPQDIEDLLPHLEQRGAAAREEAAASLAGRGRIEAASLTKILEDQRRRVIAEAGNAAERNLDLFDALERKQFAANRKYWAEWLANVDGDLEREPRRISEFYTVTAVRMEPIGLAYLWPVTG